MSVKKKIPWGLLYIILLFMLVGAYFISGLFTFPDINLLNYGERLKFIFLHPFHFWWNEKTPVTMGVACILWLMGVSYFLTYYRNYHFDAEHGTADWGDVRLILKKLEDPDPMRNTIVSKNIKIGFDALSNMNMLIMGGSGSGKTTGIVIPNILLGNCTNVILDIKGDLLKKYGNYLKKKGIVVKSLNLKNPLESDRYNPFLYIRNYSDLIGLITNIQNSVTPPDAQKGDPFWTDGCGLYLQSMFEYEWLESRREGRKASMNNILKLVNMESKKVKVRNEETEELEEITELQKFMNELAEEHGSDYPPVRDYRKLKEGATETVRSIIIMINAQLRLCELPEIKRIFEDDDIDLPSLGLGVGNTRKKTALFLVMRSGDTSYNLFINMLYTQAFRILRDLADNECPGGKLPIHVRLFMDEFYAGPKPADAEMLLGEIRSRNISMVPILQDVSQLKTLFPQDKWEIFSSNCSAVIYLGSGPTAYTTHKWMSDMLGEMTIDTRSESISQGKSGSASLQNSKAGMKLMTPEQVREMPNRDCILLIEGMKPIYDRKNRPFATKVWKDAEAAAGANGYTHPVRVIHNKEQDVYKTVDCEKKIVLVDKEEEAFYRDAAKTDKSIHFFDLDNEGFLYLNWDEEKPITPEELKEIVRTSKKRDVSAMEEPEDVSREDNSARDGEKNEIKDNLDLSGSVLDCIKRHADRLSDKEIEIILECMQNSIDDRLVKKLFTLRNVTEMETYKKLYLLQIQR
ncbi:MAG: type IV secretory system conjugative DNA transfer family protein [Oscillospiraceae bacterium]|nr:type IV secretory system conjugative DNA transfer family protein [Oscillospiraceae bacterium]